MLRFDLERVLANYGWRFQANEYIHPDLPFAHTNLPAHRIYIYVGNDPPENQSYAWKHRSPKEEGVLFGQTANQLVAHLNTLIRTV